MKYGKRFRELRVKQGFSLVEVSRDITSEPTLSRWETGKGPMDIDRIPALLKRINCTVNDLFVFDNNQIEIEIIRLYDNKDKEGLYELTQKLLVVFQQQIRSYDCLFNIVMACNYYQRLTNKNLLTNLAIRKLSRRISDVEIWTENIVALIKLALPLISNDIIFKIAVNIKDHYRDCREVCVNNLSR
ncbi:helix-turn-helix transcriptional regulator [uncultured Lactobacillus sp.]|uniref:helix-turn-helix domain-containing protein n=1 Tax=uncultured Lactobacillus sp. TaxID=153152 RepID=UPI0026035240|nr:helix-turn-helix transcriptional regulator [uncultured Lactobacillus sp.]